LTDKEPFTWFYEYEKIGSLFLVSYDFVKDLFYVALFPHASLVIVFGLWFSIMFPMVVPLVFGYADGCLDSMMAFFGLTMVMKKTMGDKSKKINLQFLKSIFENCVIVGCFYFDTVYQGKTWSGFFASMPIFSFVMLSMVLGKYGGINWYSYREEVWNKHI